MTKPLTAGEKIARDLCEMDAPTDNIIEVDPVDVARRIDEVANAELATLKAENESLKRDAERLDWMERKSEESRSGVTFQRVRYAEDGNVVESGYRVMSFHNIGELHQTLRVAIDAAMAQGGN